MRSNLWRETERAEERSRAKERRENGKDDIGVDLRYEEKLRGMRILPVAELVSYKADKSDNVGIHFRHEVLTEYGLNFIFWGLLDEGIIDYNVLALPKGII